MSNRAYRRATAKADRRTGKRSFYSASRKFRPSQFRAVNKEAEDHSTSLFYYNGIEMVWTAEFLPLEQSWQLALSCANYSGSPISNEEINAFLQESGMVKELPIDSFSEYSSLDGTLLHYYVQMLPEEPQEATDCPLCFVRVEDQGLLPLTPEMFNTLLTFEPGKIKEVMKNPTVEDEAAIIFAHKIIAKCPYSTGTQRVESVKWLHNLGCKVNMGLS